MHEKPNPLDTLSSQSRGRLLTLEVLVTLLLSKRSNAEKLLREADEILVAIEASLGEAGDETIVMFEAARQSLAKIDREARPRAR